MKLKIYLFALSLFLFVGTVSAQETRTVATRVADVLALLPAKDPATSRRLFEEMIQLDGAGLALVADGVRPNGDLKGVPYRYAISLLSHYAASAPEKVVVESAILEALSKASDQEVKAYFIQNLELVGSSKSVPALAAKVREPELSEASVSALQTIGSAQAVEALRVELGQATAPVQVRIVKALGELGDKQSLSVFTGMMNSENALLRKQALWSIALVADPQSAGLMLSQAKTATFRNGPTEPMIALMEYMERLRMAGSVVEVKVIQNTVLENALAIDQQQFRLAALRNFVLTSPAESQKMLVGELNRFDAEYRNNVLNIAQLGMHNQDVFTVWTKQYKKSKGKIQAEILQMLSVGRSDDAFAEQYLLPALRSSNLDVRIVAVRQLAVGGQGKYTDVLFEKLITATSEVEIQELQAAILRIARQEQIAAMAERISSVAPRAQVSIVELLADRRVEGSFNKVILLTASTNAAVREAAFKALPFVASSGDISELLTLLAASVVESETVYIQAALIQIVNASNAAFIAAAFPSQRIKLIPVLPFVENGWALDSVKSAFAKGSVSEKDVAFNALTSWRNAKAVPTLMQILSDDQLQTFHAKAFQGYVRQVTSSGWPDDQKLLSLRAVMDHAKTVDEKKLVVRAAGGVRTFLSLVFVSRFIEDPELMSTASRSAMRIALPTAAAKPGLEGLEVRNILGKVMKTLTGEDSQYDRIDVATYLESMPHTKGYESIFNGSDLGGWQGLVDNPILRAGMTKAVLAERQKQADLKIGESWRVKDGMIYFSGDGANLCTVRSFQDFEMLVDYKISKNGDSGIYLRGTPQVQIWDIARVADGAQVGSGGLYNNSKGIKNPLVVADNPIGAWNTMRITMVGEQVTVYLNGQLTVDHVVMENYWDRKIPIFPEGAIELQAHGTELAFRDIYVRELNKPYQLSPEEKDGGYEVLFNGKDLSGWVGNKTDYVVEDNCIAIYPAGGGHGNLFTEKEYSDFIYRFEFQLTPAANNGLGIHAPLEGDAAYVGKELQILDDTSPAYANIQPYQAHGSVYGIVPAKRGFLKPVGEWNYQEVHVVGDQIKITLNGTVIVDANLKKASANGTIDKQNHPGLNRHKGHIGFLGHGSVLRFRNIRIRNLEMGPK